MQNFFDVHNIGQGILESFISIFRMRAIADKDGYYFKALVYTIKQLND